MYMYRRKCWEKTSHSVHKRTVVRRYGWNDNITFTVQPCPYPGCQACNVLMKLLKNRLKFKSLVHRFICWSVLGHWIILYFFSPRTDHTDRLQQYSSLWQPAGTELRRHFYWKGIEVSVGTLVWCITDIKIPKN